MFWCFQAYGEELCYGHIILFPAGSEQKDRLITIAKSGL